MSRARFLYTVLLCSFVFTKSVTASAGTLDTTFNPGGTPPGTVTTAVGVSSEGYGLAIQQDGKIIIVGDSGHATAIRYNTDGTLDATFGTGGIVTTSVGTDSIFQAVAVQQDGKIVAAGQANSTTTQLLVVRYNTDGTLDTSFNGTGIVTTPVGDGGNAAGNSIALQQDGKIVVGGLVIDSGGQRFLLARYNTNGSLDTSFNGTGTVISFIGTADRIDGVALQTDGKIVVTGFARIGGVFRFITARYNTNGTLDTSFNGIGYNETIIGTFAQGFSVAVAQDGKIVSAGRAIISGSNNIVVVRYNTDGTVDTTFGTSGIATTLIGTDAQGRGVVIQQDDKIAVAGFATVSGTVQFALALYNPDGTLDVTFSPSGTPPGTVTTVIDTYAEGRALALQADGKLVVGGMASAGDGNEFAVARYFSTFTPTPPTPSTNACALRLINKYGPRLL